MPRYGQPAGTGPVKLPPVNQPKASAKGQFGLPKKKRKVPAKGGPRAHQAPATDKNMPEC